MHSTPSPELKELSDTPQRDHFIPLIYKCLGVLYRAGYAFNTNEDRKYILEMYDIFFGSAQSIDAYWETTALKSHHRSLVMKSLRYILHRTDVQHRFEFDQNDIERIKDFIELDRRQHEYTIVDK